MAVPRLYNLSLKHLSMQRIHPLIHQPQTIQQRLPAKAHHI